MTATEGIQIHLEDHLIKTHTMRGSPYFKAFEVEVCDWETQLARIQSILEIWLRVQHHWLYLEPIFTTEDIIMQMPAEAKMFKDVDTCWRNVMELVDQNPSVLAVTDAPDVLEMLSKSQATIKRINLGLRNYLKKTRMAFPRLFFLSQAEVLSMLSETRDPTKVQGHLRHCFTGIHSLEFDDLHEAHAMISGRGERIPFSAPIRSGHKRIFVSAFAYVVPETHQLFSAIPSGDSPKF